MVLQASDRISVGSGHAGCANGSAIDHLTWDSLCFIDKDTARRCGKQLRGREVHYELSAIVRCSDFHDRSVRELTLVTTLTAEIRVIESNWFITMFRME